MAGFYAKIKKTIEKLPKTSGVYLFYGSTGSPRAKRKGIIYIGKAINIKERVKNHFARPSYRDNLFIEKVSKIDFIETNSEIEALVLEAQLIKKYRPKFNVVWKDDKNYFYVAIANNKDGIPYVFITHQIHKSKILNRKSKINYIGPFTEGQAIKKTLKYLRRVFPFYTSAGHSKNKCSWCHLGLCPGTAPDLAEYKKNIKKLVLILRGKRKNVLHSLKREMQLSSNTQAFEYAVRVREKIRALESIMAHAHVIDATYKIDGRLFYKYTNSWEKTEKILRKILEIDKPVSKIECYDISNIQGKFAVGSMAVFVNGIPDKSRYKKFSIRIANASNANIRMHPNAQKKIYELLEEKPNDIAMLKQVLTRRLAHPEWGYPEIMLIDGGIAQLNVAIKVKSQNAKVKIKVIS
ncbi:MAG: GIY-YIG nuclease family protein, partial [Patescibacteria group bacterium]